MAGEIPKTEEPLVVYEEDDERGSKETVLQKYFLQEWKLVKYILDDIVSNGRVSDLSSVHRIRSIVRPVSPSRALSRHSVVSLIA